MSWTDYTDRPNDQQRKLQDDYKSFMRTVAQLVARDKGLTTANDRGLASRIEDFVADAYEVEAKIAQFASNSEYQQDPHIEANRVSLSDLKQRTGDEIDWLLQVSYLFNEASVTGDTKVVVPYPTYLTNLTAMIRGLDAAARNRKLHNYLIWRLLEVYVMDLSSDYTHANRQFLYDKWGYARFEGVEKYCFQITTWYFKVALGALYINARFDMKNRDKVTEITEAVKSAMQNMISQSSWMDPDTKDYAISRIKTFTYQIGFPDFMDDESKVDDVYRQLTINQSDFFKNLMEMNQQQQRRWNTLLREGFSKSQWWFSPFYTMLTIYWSWDEVTVPAGILRFPMYEFDMPHYYSFGAFGTVLAHIVHHLIDELGRHWDKGGMYLQSERGWWSQATLTNYNQVRQCVADLYSNATQGPYVSYNGEEKTVNINGSTFAWEAMAITTGIRLAFNAYEIWQQKYGQDFTSPGLSYSSTQLFFIAHAQFHCYNMDPFYQYLYTTFGRVHEDTRVNLALKELPEFRQAFQCQSADYMVSAKPCTYI